MIIKRKYYSSNFQQPSIEQQPEINADKQNMTSKDLQIEQMRLQGQMIETQKMRQRLQAEERMQRMRQISQVQKMEQKKDEEEKDNQIKVRKIENQKENNNSENIGLYKTKSKPVQPVSMKMS